MSEAAVTASRLPLAVSACLGLKGVPKSAAAINATVAPDAADQPSALVNGLRLLGIDAAVVPATDLAPDLLPVVVKLPDGAVAVVTEEGAREVEEDGTLGASIAHVDLKEGVALVFRLETSRDTRADGIVAGEREGWFWPVLWRYRSYFFEAAALSAVINILSLAGIVFMMTVYDRVLPNQAYVTLWSLAGGVVVAMLFEFGSRTLRGHVLDGAGKKIDVVLGDVVFTRVLATRLEHRAASSGAFANVLKEFESVRAFVTSATLAGVADLPFALLFLAVMAIIAGPLAYVAVAAFLFVVLLSIAVQAPLARLAKSGLREGAVRHGTVIESLDGLETLKALRAEASMRRRHEQASAAIAASAVQSQSLSNLVLNLTVLVQQAAGALLLVWGVYLAAEGSVTAGALIASVQLSSRALAPLVTISSLAVRFQQARSALASLNGVMALPLERERDRPYLSGTHWRGELEMREVTFSYEADGPPALNGVSLHIKPGERIAILGRMGSGKSTLLRLLAALYRAREGRVLLDGVELSAIEPSDVRSTAILVGQDARLFHGTLRENVRMAAPSASDADFVQVVRATGVAEIAAAHPLGFERPVGERGDTLSGGQRQAVALARAILARPKVLLLDEPTAAMDQRSEAEVMRVLSTLPRESSVVVVTHKQSLLPLVDRIVVLDKGRVVADGAKADVLAALGDGRVRAAA